MKKIIFFCASICWAISAKADIVIVYKCGTDTCSTIKQTSLKCEDFKWEPHVIGCYDLKSTSSGRLDNGQLKEGIISNSNGLVLGQAKDVEKSKADESKNVSKPYKIEKAETNAKGEISANGLLLGTAIKKE